MATHRGLEHLQGGGPGSSRKLPGRTEYGPITLDLGVTHDLEVEQWANKVWALGGGLGSEQSLVGFRKNIRIEVYTEAGRLSLAYQGLQLLGLGVPGAARPGRIRQCPVVIQRIELENEGWEQDAEVPEPDEPCLAPPGSAWRPLPRRLAAARLAVPWTPGPTVSTAELGQRT